MHCSSHGRLMPLSLPSPHHAATLVCEATADPAARSVERPSTRRRIRLAFPLGAELQLFFAAVGSHMSDASPRALVAADDTREASGDVKLDPVRRAELNDLFRRHRTELVQYIRRAFGDGPPDPEDAVQQAFAKLATLSTPASVGNPRAFLYRCASNFVLDTKRRTAVRAKFAVSADAQIFLGGAEEITPERVLDAKERAAILEEAIRGLKPRHRRALILNRIHGMTYAEVARSLNVSESEARRLVTVAVNRCDRALSAAETALPVSDKRDRP